MKIFNLNSFINQINIQKLKLSNFIISKIDKRQRTCIIIGIFLSILSIVTTETIFINKNEIKRNSYGMKDSEYTLYVTGLNDAKEEIKFAVSSMRYTKESANEAFDNLFSKLPDYILNNNSSFDDIKSNLKLTSYFSNEGIFADYLFKIDEQCDETSYEKYRNILNPDGSLNNDELSSDEIVKGHLKIIFSCYINNSNNIRYTSDPYIIPVSIKSKELELPELLKLNLIKSINNIDKATIEEPTIALPSNIDGTDIKIDYTEKHNFTYLFILFITIIIAMLLPLRDKSKLEDEKKNRIKLLSNSYYSFVTKLAIYIGAGETIKNALERITTLYLSNNEQSSPLYNELEISIRKINNGIGIDEVLSELSNRIGLRQYTKLFTILEQNRKNGSSDVKTALYNELGDAFKERKLKAKILGEEAQTKLIFPLIMMLGIVLVIIMVPAITGI